MTCRHTNSFQTNSICDSHTQNLKKMIAFARILLKKELKIVVILYFTHCTLRVLNRKVPKLERRSTHQNFPNSGSHKNEILYLS